MKCDVCNSGTVTELKNKGSVVAIDRAGLRLRAGVRVTGRGTDKHPPVVCFGRDGQDHHGYCVYQCAELNPEGPHDCTATGDREREMEKKKKIKKWGYIRKAGSSRLRRIVMLFCIT